MHVDGRHLQAMLICKNGSAKNLGQTRPRGAIDRGRDRLGEKPLISKNNAAALCKLWTTNKRPRPGLAPLAGGGVKKAAKAFPGVPLATRRP